LPPGELVLSLDSLGIKITEAIITSIMTTGITTNFLSFLFKKRNAFLWKVNYRCIKTHILVKIISM
jgi:hypothetical protein